MPFFSVTVTASVDVLIEADDEQEAVNTAFMDANFSDAGHKEAGEAVELKTEDEIASARRHADHIITN